MSHVGTDADRDDGAAVRLTSVVVERGSRRALDGVDLTIERGGIVGIIGPSGCGKSTLMRSIVGVQQHVTGEVEVLGRPAGEASRDGQVGYMTQDAAVYDDLSVRENVGYIGRLLGVDAARVDEVLASVDMADFADRRAADLSGGQRARVSLAIALVNGARLLVLDEPTVGLDPVLRRDLWDHFASLAAAGRTVLVSSHVMDEAERCDRLVLLRDGRVLAFDTPEALRLRTGAETIEQAFLALIDAARDGDGGRP